MRRIVPLRPDSDSLFPAQQSLPADKSLLHRLLFFSALAKGTTHILLPDDSQQLAADILSTIHALETLGVSIERINNKISVTGTHFRTNNSHLHIDCGNSGTTARFLMGLLAGRNITTTLTGDRTLSERPMKRLADLLNKNFGARVETASNGSLPVTIHPSTLHPAEAVKLPVPSAQIETALTLASLSCEEPSTFERTAARNHTRAMLRAFGAKIEEFDNESGTWQKIYPSSLTALHDEYNVPLDISAAAFWFVLAAIMHTKISIKNVLINESRTGVLDVLRLTGVEIVITSETEHFGESSGTVTLDARNTKLKSFDISGMLTTRALDEIPFIAILAAFAEGSSAIRDAKELRVKESDRLNAVAAILTQLGCSVQEFPDGVHITPKANTVAPELSITTHSDHRIAMCGVLASIGANLPAIIDDPDSVAISYPEFWNDVKYFFDLFPVGHFSQNIV